MNGLDRRPRFLRVYVDLRVLTAADPAGLAERPRPRGGIQTELWNRAEAMARAHPDSQMGAIFVEALNAVIDLHAERMVAIFNRIPISNWLAIFFVALLTLALEGFNDGLTENRKLDRAMWRLS